MVGFLANRTVYLWRQAKYRKYITSQNSNLDQFWGQAACIALDAVDLSTDAKIARFWNTRRRLINAGSFARLLQGVFEMRP